MDWIKLREKFFRECVEPKKDELPRVAIAPHDLFEWFKRNVEEGVNKELHEALTELIHLHTCEQEGLSSGQPTPQQWFEAVDKGIKALEKVNKK